MASSDAIAFLGDTIVSLLKNGLGGLVSAGNITLSTPNEFKTFSPAQPAVTVFLYHAAINGEMRNAQPTSFGGSGSRPLLPLDVRFLITPWTPVPRDSYRIIGAIAIVLAHSAVLGFGDLEGGPDIWAPDDTVALVLESIPIEEHYDIWEPTGVPYRLSLTYLARVMGLDPATAPGGPPVVLAKLAPVPA